MSGLATVLQVLFTALSTDPTIQAAGFKVYADEAPENAAGPHLVVGDSIEVPRDTFGRRGWQGTERVHVWIPTATGLPVRQAIATVEAAIEGVAMRVVQADVLHEPGWAHAIAYVRPWTRE